MIKRILKANDIVATKHRVELLTLMANSDVYLSAYDLEKLMNNLDISTIYRSLNLFEEKGILIKNFNNEENLFKYKYLKQDHFHYLKCINCDKKIKIDFCPMNIYDQSDASKNNFKVVDYVFELYGYCETCQSVL